MADAGRHDECKTRPGQCDELLGAIKQIWIVRDIAIDIAHRSESKDDAPIIRLVNKLRRDILQGAQAKVRRPVQTVDHLVWKVMVKNEMDRRRLHAQLRGRNERLLEIDRLEQGICGDIRIHATDLLIAVAFAMKLVKHCRRDPRMHDMWFAV